MKGLGVQLYLNFRGSISEDSLFGNIRGFLTWVTRICGVMPPSFTAIRMKRITVYSHFHVGFSDPLATCLTQTVSWDKGKQVVDLRVGWLTSK